MWLFEPEGTPRTVSRAMKSICTDRGWKFEQRTAHRRSLPDHRNRDVRAHLLSSQQATQLYVRMHLRNIGVIEVDKIHVPITANPRNSLRYFLPMHQFLTYKSMHQRIDSGTSGDRWAEQAANDLQDWIDRQTSAKGRTIPAVCRFMCSPQTQNTMTSTRRVAGDGSIRTMDHRGQGVTSRDVSGTGPMPVICTVVKLCASQVVSSYESSAHTRIPLGCLDRFARDRTDRRVQYDRDLEGRGRGVCQPLPGRTVSQRKEIHANLSMTDRENKKRPVTGPLFAYARALSTITGSTRQRSGSHTDHQ